jgi:hypothetical protein
MKTMIAEKMMLLIVIGSQVLEPIGAWGRSGIVVGSFGRTILLMVVAEGSQLRANLVVRLQFRFLEDKNVT